MEDAMNSEPIKKVLLVEDNCGDARLVQEMLRKGYEVSHVRSLAEALATVEASTPDLLLLDLTLPDSHGLESLQKLHAALEAPIVVLTGLSDAAVAQESVTMGAQDYLVKGDISESVLRRVLCYALERARHAREMVELERRLAQSRKLEAVGQLAAGIAHEINTPTQYVSDNTRFIREALSDLVCALTKLQSEAGGEESLNSQELASILEEADVDYLVSELPRAIDQSLEGLTNIARIVRAMKDFSHPASEDKKPTDVNAALRTTLVVASNEWKYVAEVEDDLDPDLPAASALPGELNQVFLNLIVNAAHAIGDQVGDAPDSKGRLGLRTSVDGDWIEVCISDSGCGIPQENLEKIFEPFFTTKEVGKGTGQGLAIAYDVIVNKHGGTISVDSTVGRGTCFTMRLPVARELEAIGASSEGA